MLKKLKLGKQLGKFCCVKIMSKNKKKINKEK